ncbi:MAG TPA: hypothetical protein VHY20_12950, partial [Pirellulales bacterium]|nr:hypothetical protein [Pirellulales bacterium]
RDGQPRVRLILAGTRSLEERLANPKLDSLSQRMAVRSYLAPLERAETAAYMRSQIAVLGGHADQIFTPDALDAIHQATGGIPRLINQLGDHALVLAYAGGRCQIDRARVEEAWSDLQQLPAPWNETEADGAAADVNVIEFGELDDEDEPEALTFSMQQMMSPGPAPAVRLDEITAQLAALDDEFDVPEPLESLPAMMPRMQCDPFAETFLEEEVVLDRYASADASMSDHQSVTSLEGSLLGSLLEPFMHDDARPQLAMAGDGAFDLHSVTIAAPAPAAPQLRDDQRWADGYPLKPSAVVEEWQSWPGDASLPPEGEAMSERDEEIIVVENDPQLPRPAGSQSGARRQEYRQLFAKMRRG